MTRGRRFTARELWYLAAAPAAWFAHFVLLYGAAAVVCARPEIGAAFLLWAVLFATVLASVVVTRVAVRGYHAFHPAATGEGPDWPVFLGELLLGIACVSGVGILVTASVPLVVGVCR